MVSAEDSTGHRETVLIVLPEIESMVQNWSKSLFLAIMNMGTKHAQDLDVQEWNENLFEQLGMWSVCPKRNI